MDWLKKQQQKQTAINWSNTKTKKKENNQQKKTNEIITTNINFNKYSIDEGNKNY